MPQLWLETIPFQGQTGSLVKMAETAALFERTAR
jgi:hypothetical protein